MPVLGSEPDQIPAPVTAATNTSKAERKIGGRPVKANRDDRARETINIILRMTEEHHRPPTRRELADACGLRSVATVIEHLEVLYKRGYIMFEVGCVRSLWVTRKGEMFVADVVEPE